MDSAAIIDLQQAPSGATTPGFTDWPTCGLPVFHPNTTSDLIVPIEERMMSKTIEAWHFLSADRRIAHAGQPHGRTLVVPGQKLTLLGPVVLCESGFHASERAIDALQYAPGPVVQRVRLSGEIVRGHDKLAATERECLWIMDASVALHIAAVNFAQVCLDERIEKGLPVDPRSQEALRVKLRWIRGEATNDELSAAESAAWSAAAAAESAAAAAWSSAWSAARSAAWSAARSAAESAARSAAESAQWSAAWSAAESAQDDILTAALLTQHESGHRVFA